MTTKRRGILAIAAVLAVALVATAIWTAMPAVSAKIYRDSIRRAELAFEQGDYEAAVLAYQKAIQANDTSVEAYEGLYNTYLAMDDISNARAILEDGIAKTHSEWLTRLLARLDGEGDGEEAGAVEVIAGAQGEKSASLNQRLLKRVAVSTYRDYQRKGVSLSEEIQEDGSVRVRFKEINGIMVFRNSARQAEAVNNGIVSESALPDEVILDNIEELFGKTPITRDEIEKFGISGLRQIVDGTRRNLLQFDIYGCTITAVCDGSGTISGGADNTIVPTSSLAQASLKAEGEAVLAKGSIIDAQTGEPVDEITIRFFEDEDTSGDPLIDPVVTNSSGEYEVNLPPGTYIAELSGEGYITTTKEVIVGEYGVESEGDFVVTRDLAEGEARLVLEWGGMPQDLDSYIFGETDGGTHFRLSRWEGSFSGDGISMELDLDDRDGYGPETITIHGFEGVFRYNIADYMRTGTMAQYGAEATIYMPGQAPVTVTLDSSSGVEDSWLVCTIDHGVLTINNTAYDGGWSHADK